MNKSNGFKKNKIVLLHLKNENTANSLLDTLAHLVLCARCCYYFSAIAIFNSFDIKRKLVSLFFQIGKNLV